MMVIVICKQLTKNFCIIRVFPEFHSHGSNKQMQNMNRTVSSAAFNLHTGKRQAQWTQTSVWVIMDSATASKRPTTRQSPLKSHTMKKTEVLSAACHESKRNYDQSRAGTRINIRYALDSWRQLHLELGLQTDADMPHFLVTR